MFGYVKTFKPDMRICEYDAYKAVYCGLCHQLGKSFGPFARFTLNYDFTFLSVLAIAVNPDFPGIKRKICPANPFKKKQAVDYCDELKLSASAAMIIFYHKICDNIQDNAFFSKLKYIALKPAAYFYKRRAAKNYPELESAISAQLKRQYKIEASKSAGIDQAADPTACALADVFASLTADETQKRVLSRFGYLLGRWIYLIDAVDDFADDVSSGGFNPFAIKLGANVADKTSIFAMIDQAQKVLNYTITELAKAYELITIHRFKPIMDNIIYLGLKHTQETIFKNAKEKYN